MWFGMLARRKKEREEDLSLQQWLPCHYLLPCPVELPTLVSILQQLLSCVGDEDYIPPGRSLHEHRNEPTGTGIRNIKEQLRLNLVKIQAWEQSCVNLCIEMWGLSIEE